MKFCDFDILIHKGEKNYNLYIPKIDNDHIEWEIFVNSKAISYSIYFFDNHFLGRYIDSQINKPIPKFTCPSSWTTCRFYVTFENNHVVDLTINKDTGFNYVYNNDAKLEYKFFDNKSDNLCVIFDPVNISAQKDVEYDVQRTNVLRNISFYKLMSQRKSCNYIYINDSNDGYVDWYLGYNSYFLEQTVINFLNNQKNLYSSVKFFGSSKGGWGALHFAQFVNVDEVLVIAPICDLNYYSTSISEISKKLLPRVLFSKLTVGNISSKVTMFTSDKDNSWKEQLAFSNKNPNCEIIHSPACLNGHTKIINFSYKFAWNRMINETERINMISLKTYNSQIYVSDKVVKHETLNLLLKKFNLLITVTEKLDKKLLEGIDFSSAIILVDEKLDEKYFPEQINCDLANRKELKKFIIEQ